LLYTASELDSCNRHNDKSLAGVNRDKLVVLRLRAEHAAAACLQPFEETSMSPEENDGQGQEQSGIGLPRTATSAILHATGGLISSVGIPHVSIHAGNLIFGDSTTSGTYLGR
jgi:hypothetical protein